MLHLLSRSFFVLLLTVGLAACESSEERAEGHYQSALALLEDGDRERALVELRNVFELDGSHRGARKLYAGTVRGMGDASEAYGQYLRLVEQYPDDLEGRIALAEMSFVRGDVQEFARHAEPALEAAGADADPQVQALAQGLAYHEAAQAEDMAALRDVMEAAALLHADAEANPVLRRLLVAGYIALEEPAQALEVIDTALVSAPDDRTYQSTRLGLLVQMEDDPAIEAQLRDMVLRFPQDDAFKGALIQFYISRERPDEVESFLREIADYDAEEPEFYLALVQFIGRQNGPDAAIAELDTAIAAAEEPARYRALRASLMFERGERAEAIAEMETILDGLETGDLQQGVRVSLARMLQTDGNEVGARRLVETVLEVDPTQVDALKMRAIWQIGDDDTDGAIISLRSALDQAPQDAAAMTLMAQAYLRAGQRDLARDFLSLAVEASEQAPAAAIRYATLLREDDQLLPAERTLIGALRLAPGNVELLSELGQLYLQMEDLPRARQVLADLERLDRPDAEGVLRAMRLALVERDEGRDAALEVLEGMVAQGEGDVRARIAVVRGHIATGDGAAALEAARAAVAETPDDPTLRHLLATTQAATGDLDAAEAGYRALLEDDPALPQVWMSLIRILPSLDRADEIPATLDEGLVANPVSADLLWARAGLLEQTGDVDGAIDIYERLYAQNSETTVVANNLASLLSVHRADEASLERAWQIARRLRGSEVPAFQDTYGWIAYQRGDYEEALAHLEPAAEGLSGDALTQYHLAKLYQALERPEEARAQFARVVELAGPDDTRPQIEEARAEVAQ